MTTDAAPRLRLELAGLPRVVCSDGRTWALEPRDGALLALVALEGPIGRDRVYDILWAGCDRKAAQGNLRQRLFRLRRKLGRDGVVADAVLRLAPSVECDLLDRAPPPARLLAGLRFDADAALADWMAGARQRLHRDHCASLAADASRLEAGQQIAAALDIAERPVLLEPSLEHAHRRVMRLHYRRGDRAAALGAWQRCRSVLVRELGTVPSAETAALAATIERSGALPDPSPGPPPVALSRPPRLVGRDATGGPGRRAGRRDGSS